MIYILTTVLFLVWAFIVCRKGRITLHSAISAGLVALYLSDIVDETCDHFFNFYDLPAKLLSNKYSDEYLGLVFSDAILFPLVAIIFCYYIVQYQKPWFISFLFAFMMGMMELAYVKTGYMVYHHWNHWITPVITFFAFRLLANFANRFIAYSPPIPYGFWLACLIYAISELPGSFLGFGIMHRYQYNPHIFKTYIANDRSLELLHGYVLGDHRICCYQNSSAK